MHQYNYEGDLNTMTLSELENFVNNFGEGKFEPFVKGEPVPEDNNKPVKVVVSRNWDNIVGDRTKDVLVLVYDNMFEDVSDIKKEWAAKLAEEFKGVEDFVVATFNGPKNQFPEIYKDVLNVGWLFQKKDEKDYPNVLKPITTLQDLSTVLKRHYNMEDNPNTPRNEEL